MSSPVCVQVIVSGRVQGVCYRAFVYDKARELGVFGWVRNLYDGRVEAQVQGKQEDVDRLVEAMRTGPHMARVDEIEVLPLKYENRYGEFRVVYG
jgi:acylphosphatase